MRVQRPAVDPEMSNVRDFPAESGLYFFEAWTYTGSATGQKGAGKGHGLLAEGGVWRPRGRAGSAGGGHGKGLGVGAGGGGPAKSPPPFWPQPQRDARTPQHHQRNTNSVTVGPRHTFPIARLDQCCWNGSDTKRWANQGTQPKLKADAPTTRQVGSEYGTKCRAV